MEDLRRVFINFNFENDLLQLVIENPMVRTKLCAMHVSEVIPSKLKYTLKSMLRIRGIHVHRSSGITQNLVKF